MIMSYSKPTQTKRVKLKLTLRCKVALWLCPGICPSLPEKEAITQLEQEAQDRKLTDNRRRGLIRDINMKYGKKRPRTKFKKRWPYKKHNQ